jgi:hypothetical protein
MKCVETRGAVGATDHLVYAMYSVQHGIS